VDQLSRQIKTSFRLSGTNRQREAGGSNDLWYSQQFRDVPCSTYKLCSFFEAIIIRGISFKCHRWIEIAFSSKEISERFRYDHYFIDSDNLLRDRREKTVSSKSWRGGKQFHYIPTDRIVSFRYTSRHSTLANETWHCRKVGLEKYHKVDPITCKKKPTVKRLVFWGYVKCNSCRKWKQLGEIEESLERLKCLLEGNFILASKLALVNRFARAEIGDDPDIRSGVCHVKEWPKWFSLVY
jgi:hypothetical protein